MDRTFESPYVMSFPPGWLAKHSEIYHWTGWKDRHWPANIVRPEQVIYGFDRGDRLLNVLFRVTRGGSFTYRSKDEFEKEVKRLTDWSPSRSDPHWKRISGARNVGVNTGIAFRGRVLKRVRMRLSGRFLQRGGRFPQLGWLDLRGKSLPPQEGSDLATQVLTDMADEQRRRSTTTTKRPQRKSGPINRLKALYNCECQFCGASFGFGRRRCIPIHHIDPAKGDYWPNLVVICPNHHFEVELALRHNLRVRIDLKQRRAVVGEKEYPLRVRPGHLDTRTRKR